MSWIYVFNNLKFEENSRNFLCHLEGSSQEEIVDE
jgi:hypothetical protein